MPNYINLPIIYTGLTGIDANVFLPEAVGDIKGSSFS